VLSCKQVVDRADALIAGEMTLRQRCAMWYHLAICVYCRRYLRQLKLLLQTLPRLRRRVEPEQVEAVMQRLRNLPHEGDRPDDMP
jgi:hypothetical protein